MSLTHATFSREIERRHRRVDVDAWDDIYIVGDVHGCRDALADLLEKLDPDDDDLVVFVGDLVRKGPDSRGVLREVASRENFLSVRGNNENKLLNGEKSLPDLTPEDLEYVERLPLAISFDDALVVHGGIDPRKPLHEQSLEEILTMRSTEPGGGYDGPFWFERYDGSPRVFFGHTVLEEPVVTDSAVGLDTGCVYGGSLTAYDFRNDELVSVPLERDGKDRADRKIVTPPNADN